MNYKLERMKIEKKQEKNMEPPIKKTKFSAIRNQRTDLAHFNCQSKRRS